MGVEFTDMTVIMGGGGNRRIRKGMLIDLTCGRMGEMKGRGGVTHSLD